MFPEKHSSFEPPSVDICSKNELVVKLPKGDVSLSNGHCSTLENEKSVINLQMEHGKNFVEVDATKKLNGSVDTSTMTHYAKDLNQPQRKDLGNKLCQQGVDVLEHDASNDHVLPINNSVRSMPPERQLEQKERDKVEFVQKITVQDAFYGYGISDEISCRPKDDTTSGRDSSCKLPKEHHVEVQTKRAETILPSHLGAIKSDVLRFAGKEKNYPQTLQSPPKRVCIGHSKKKLLVLDVNGLLVDVVRSPCPIYNPHKMVSNKAVFKRPYCDDFLEFCFERFNVGVWSSRVKKNLDEIIDFLLDESRKNLLFCWHASQCTNTGLNTIENENKPLVLKELKKLWEKLEPNLPWEKGEYNETNTLLLDDSPYKALCNPAYTAIFPYPYDYRNFNDSSLGPTGDLRVYLEGLAIAENVQEYVWQNPFGQQAITKENTSWDFYSKVFHTKPCAPPYVGGDSKVTNAAVEVCLNGNFHNEYAEKGAKSSSNSLKVDEFGRLVREGVGESDSDDYRYNGRQGKRGSSRSRSPLDRWKRRSPWRRREKRSRSRSPRSRSRSPRNQRSWSRVPRNRRSRSRSPVRRRNSVGELSGECMRRDRGQIAVCIDFRRGRCYRGASCRYLHHDSEKADGSKCHRIKQHWEVPHIPKDSNTHGEITHNFRKESDQEHHVDKISEMQQGQARNSVGELSGECMRRDRGQIAVCIDFRRGRCYRGASCWYLHHDSEKADGSKCNRIKQHWEVPHIPKDSNTHGEITHKFRKESDQEHHVDKISEMQQGQARNSVGELSGECMRRDRGQIAVCIDFRRGRCYRGACCWYLHHDSEKADGSKCHRIKQHWEVPHIPKDSNTHGEITHNFRKESDQEHHVDKISEMQQGQARPGSRLAAGKDMHYEKREESINNSKQFGHFDQDSQLIDSHMDKSDTFKSGGAFPYILPPENPLTMPSQSKLSNPLLQIADHPPQQTDKSSFWDSSPELTSRTSVNKLPLSEAVPNTIDFRHHSPQLPPRPPAFAEGATAEHMAHPPGNYNLISQSASLASQSASGERFPSYMLPGQLPNFSAPPIPTWAALPPPSPGVSSHIRPHAAALQVGDFQQQAYPPMQEPKQSLSYAEDFSLKPLPPYNLQSQQFLGHGLLREDQSTHFPKVGPRISSSFPQGENQHVLAPFLQELSAGKMKPSYADNMPPLELLKSTSQIHPQLKQQPRYVMHHSVSVGSSSKFPLDLQEVNQPSHPLDFRGSRNSTCNNPRASTFVQPPSCKFSSDAFRQDDTTCSSKYVSPFSMSYGPVDMRVTGSVGSRQETSSPNSARAVRQKFPSSGGNQYDPLLDSFHSSLNLSKKINIVQMWEPGSDSDIMLRHSGSNKPLDVEENIEKKKEIGGVAVATAIYNEEYGESAVAQVGAVENESPSNPSGAANLSAGEIEIDQIKSPSKSKNKESKSMKLFKVAIADFVKEILNPSWRQGNMSKEAFKTIVKNTVDTVLAGAMKSHQVPESQAKIDQYIVSSQRKLTELVMGYADKYVKM